MRNPVAFPLILAAVASCHANRPTVPGRSADRIVLSHALPALAGTHLAVQVMAVTYAPGGSSSPHGHPCPVTGYVVDGALRMQLKGQPEIVYRTGEAFYEAPGDVHVVSANASQDRSATFIAVFICDHEGPLSVTVPEPHHAGGE